MPAKGGHSRAGKEQKRRVVANGLATGRRTIDIARSARTTPRTVQRLANEPETKRLVADLLKPHWKRMEKSVGVALRAIDSALKALKTDRADHHVRLRATERLAEFLELAQAGHRAGQPEITWEQFCRIYHARQQELAAEREEQEAADDAKTPRPN
jgi:hypothetical protein